MTEILFSWDGLSWNKFQSLVRQDFLDETLTVLLTFHLCVSVKIYARGEYAACNNC